MLYGKKSDSAQPLKQQPKTNSGSIARCNSRAEPAAAAASERACSMQQQSSSNAKQA
jgi:hypothetical protein